MENNFESIGIQILKHKCRTYYARKRGKGHVINGKPCQDYCKVSNIDKDTQIVCVADGHGGEHYTKSDVGAKLACNVFCKLVKKYKKAFINSGMKGLWLNELKNVKFKHAFIEAWKAAVLNDFTKNEPSTSLKEPMIISKYGTTFLFAVYTKNGLAVGQLGDGGILLVNGYGQSQIFKRCPPKLNSATDSMASAQAEQAFLVETFLGNRFSNILISTDGIYDKFENEGFFLYEQSLESKVKKGKKWSNPFYFNGNVLSDFTRDDCTIALLVGNKKSNKFCCKGLEKHGYFDNGFKRSVGEIDIFTARKNEDLYEIHVMDKNTGIAKTDIEIKHLVKADDVVPLKNGKVGYAYRINRSWVRFNELIEGNMHLEKSYKNEALHDFNNRKSLALFENMMALKKLFEIKKIECRDSWMESAFVDSRGGIILLSDAVYKGFHLEKKVSDRCEIDRFFEYFSIFGKAILDNNAIPLYECSSYGREILFKGEDGADVCIGRVVKNKNSEMLGLWNTTEKNWELNNNKVIKPHGVLKLYKTRTFRIDNDKVLRVEMF